MNIQQNIVICPTYPDKFIRDIVTLHRLCDFRLQLSHCHLPNMRPQCTCKLLQLHTRRGGNPAERVQVREANIEQAEPIFGDFGV